jgi:hypothetical protein
MKTPPTDEMFVNPQTLDALKSDVATGKRFGTFYGHPIYVMREQVSDCLTVPDKDTARDYLNGKISESELKRLIDNH